MVGMDEVSMALHLATSFPTRARRLQRGKGWHASQLLMIHLSEGGEDIP
jgi:hypothetical protein